MLDSDCSISDAEAQENNQEEHEQHEAAHKVDTTFSVQHIAFLLCPATVQSTPRAPPCEHTGVQLS